MKLKKIIILVGTAVAFWWLWTLPIQDFRGLAGKLDSLPDYDLRGMAEELWRKGQEDSALTILDYIITQNLPDKPAADQLFQQYRDELTQQTTPLGRLKAAGWGFATGDVKSWDSVGGSTLGDFFIYGDVRDLFRELVVEDDPDTFVMVLSGAGIGTTLFPLADVPVSLLKAAKKSGNLGAPLVEQLTKILTLAKEAPDTAAKVSVVKDGLLPFYDLSKSTRTWSEYAVLVKNADNLKQVKTLAKIAADKPDNARKLSQILLVAGKQGSDKAKQALDVIMTKGQKGMDNLYAALRKGPAGLKFVADHPTLVLRTSKGGVKMLRWGQQEFADFLSSMLGRFAPLAQSIGLGVLGAVFLLVLIPDLAFNQKRSRPRNTVARASMPSDNRWLANRVLLACSAGVVIAAISIGATLMSPSQLPPLDFQPAAGGYDGAEPISRQPINEGISVLTILVALVVQAGIFLLVRDKVVQVAEGSEAPAIKAKRLDNLEIFFDLPLYAGLAMTIMAFVLISYDVGVSRVFAYTSTIFGILVAVFIRVQLVHPIKEDLLNDRAVIDK